MASERIEKQDLDHILTTNFDALIIIYS